MILCGYIYRIFFIYSSVGGHLGCFHILTIGNSAAVNIGMHVSFQISVLVFSDMYPEVELLDHMIVLFLCFFFFFEKPPYCFPQWLHQFAFPPMSFPGGSDGNKSTCNVEDLGSIPGLGRSPREGNAYSVQYYCLENSKDTGAWQAILHVDTTE